MISDTLSVGYPEVTQNFIDGKACVEIDQSKVETSYTFTTVESWLGYYGCVRVSSYT